MSNLIFQQQGSSPSDAGSGYSQIYAKSDGKVYRQAGTDSEVEISGLEATAPQLSANKASAKAWCFWGQTASDHDADTSFNVSSVTDSGAGHSTINFATAMPTVNYVVATSYNLQGGYSSSLQVTTKATGSCQLKAWYGTGGAAIDATDCNAVFYSN